MFTGQIPIGKHGLPVIIGRSLFLLIEAKALLNVELLLSGLTRSLGTRLNVVAPFLESSLVVVIQALKGQVALVEPMKVNLSRFEDGVKIVVSL